MFLKFLYTSTSNFKLKVFFHNTHDVLYRNYITSVPTHKVNMYLLFEYVFIANRFLIFSFCHNCSWILQLLPLIAISIVHTIFIQIFKQFISLRETRKNPKLFVPSLIFFFFTSSFSTKCYTSKCVKINEIYRLLELVILAIIFDYLRIPPTPSRWAAHHICLGV